MKITIKNKEYTIKYKLRALFIFEKITGKMFEISTITDEYIFLYSMLMANNPSCEITFNDLIDELDSKPNVMDEFLVFLNKENEKQKQIASEEKKSDDKKKH